MFHANLHIVTIRGIWQNHLGTHTLEESLERQPRTAHTWKRNFHNKIVFQRLKRDPISKNEFLEKNSSPFLTANPTSNFFDG
ncbi:MAG: hypothetical protein ACFFB0_22235, partial [Promethearchaeota archaeon]